MQMSRAIKARSPVSDGSCADSQTHPHPSSGALSVRITMKSDTTSLISVCHEEFHTTSIIESLILKLQLLTILAFWKQIIKTSIKFCHLVCYDKYISKTLLLHIVRRA